MEIAEAKSKHMVVVANILLDSCYTLSIAEKRVLWLLLSRIPANVERNEGLEPITGETWLTVNVENYAELAGIEKENAYKIVRKAMFGLNDRTVTLKEAFTNSEGVVIERFHWVTGCRYNDTTHLMQARLYPTIIPFLTGLKEKFAQLELGEAFSIKSRHAWKLFDFFSKYKGTPCRNVSMTLEEIRRLLGRNIVVGEDFFIVLIWGVLWKKLS